MENIWITCYFVFAVLGLIGCVVPMIPGPVLSFAGLLFLLPTNHSPSVTALVLWGIASLVVTMLDYVVSAWGTKKFNGSRFGFWGCFIGTLAGLFFLPIGIIAGPFLGAFLGELIAGRKVEDSALSGVGALVGFMAGTLVKLLVSGLIIAWFFF